MAIEAALSAERMHMETQREQQSILELELQQARYEASLAERRYAACDPDNRLIAAQLETGWEATLRRVQECESRLDAARAPKVTLAKPDFAGLAEDLDAAWKTPRVTMRTRQQLLRALVNDITVDIDEAAREIVLTIHWKGGQHSELRLRKPQSGEHDCRTSDEALAVIRSMATRGSLGGLAARTGDLCEILDGWGSRTTLIETVGVGQSELDVAEAADTVAVVLTPESGDAIQALMERSLKGE